MNALALLTSVLSLHLSGPRPVLTPLDAPQVLATVGYDGAGYSGSMRLTIAAQGGTIRPQRGSVHCDRKPGGWACLVLPLRQGATEPLSFLVTGLHAGTPLVVTARVSSPQAAASAVLRRTVRGNPPRQLAFQDAWPVWSPDGTKIAFTRTYAPLNRTELLVVDTRTRAVTKLATAGFQPLPSWSPDGTRIAYQAGGDVYVTDLNGVGRRIGKGFGPAFGPKLARVVGTTLYVGSEAWAKDVILRPAWSPDGTHIAFARSDGIYVTDGTTERKWATTDREPGSPVWSPDGAQVGYRSNETLYVASPGIVPPRAVSAFVYDMGDPSWSPTGDALVASSRWGVVLWRLSGTHTVLHASAGTGAAFSPVSGVVAYIGPRPSCPGHFGVAVAQVLTGTCKVQGTDGADVIEGTSSWGDVIVALGGNDKVHANDGHTDRVDCGPGRDEVWADRSDKLSGCEIVHR